MVKKLFTDAEVARWADDRRMVESILAACEPIRSRNAQEDRQAFAAQLREHLPAVFPDEADTLERCAQVADDVVREFSAALSADGRRCAELIARRIRALGKR